MTLDIDGRPLVGCHPIRAKLPQDGNPNLGFDGDLVPDAYPLQRWGALERTITSDEAGEHLPHLRSRIDRIHPDVVQSRPIGQVPSRVAHVQHLKVQATLITVDDDLDDVGDLLPGSILPIAAGHVSQTR